jgi:hypothetical protein
MYFGLFVTVGAQPYKSRVIEIEYITKRGLSEVTL